MTTITLDSSLKPVDLARYSQRNAKQAVCSIARTAKLEPTSLLRGKLPGTVYHANYLEYLELCWSAHLTPVLTPDILWYTMLCEIAGLIRANPEAVRSLFTTQPGKQAIIVPTDDVVTIPLDLIIDQLRGLVPSGTDTYLPTFSTTTDSARFACYAAFADAVSPYYEYFTYCCDLPAIRILGTVEDYVKVVETWKGLPDLLRNQGPKWFAIVQRTLEAIVVALEGARSDRPMAQEKAREHFRGMFAAKRCGSGSQIDIDGWFLDLFRVQPSSPRVANYDSHVAKVEYKNLTAGRKFVLLYGLFSSTVADGVLTPDFAPLVFEPAKQHIASEASLPDRAGLHVPGDYQRREAVEAAKYAAVLS